MNYKRTVLEKYRDKGWLRQVTSQYFDDDRMAAGLRLAADFHKAGYRGFNCIDYEKPRVESSPMLDLSPAVLIFANTTAARIPSILNSTPMPCM